MIQREITLRGRTTRERERLRFSEIQLHTPTGGHFSASVSFWDGFLCFSWLTAGSRRLHLLRPATGAPPSSTTARAWHVVGITRCLLGIRLVNCFGNQAIFVWIQNLAESDAYSQLLSTFSRKQHYVSCSRPRCRSPANRHSTICAPCRWSRLGSVTDHIWDVRLILVHYRERKENTK